MLTTQTFGDPATTPPLVIVHGLFGSGRNWGVIAKRLADTRHVITVDMRNHGDSFRDPDQSYEAMAADLAEVIETLTGSGAPQADVIGHSMGGKAAMILALSRPALIRRLIVADIAPVPYTHGSGHHDLIAAMRGLDLDAITTRADADAALAARVDTPAVRAFLLQSLDLRAKRWKLNLEALATNLPAILGFPDTPGSFDGSTLFLSGALSDYVRTEHRPAIKARFPGARFAKLPGTGHWLHAEKPRDFEATARAFLDA